MNAIIALLLVGGAGFYLWRSGALGGILPSSQLPTGGLMGPPQAPVPTAPTTRASGMGGGAQGGIIGAVTAAAGLLVWAIVDKGLFRGGEEGVKVNPGRDAFFQQFINWCATHVPGWSYGTTSAAQQPALATVFGIAGVDGRQADLFIQNLYAAHTVDAYTAAAQSIAEALRPWAIANNIRIEIPV